MSAISGNFTAVGVSTEVSVRPLESLRLSVAASAGETFTGVAILEKSDTNGSSWEQARTPAGVLVAWDGTSVAIDENAADITVVNEQPNSRRRYRFRCTDAGGANELNYAASQVDGDIIAVILRDEKGAPLISRRDDGKLVFHGGIAFDTPGVVEAEDVVTISSADLTGTGVGQFGHAQGYPLVAAKGADKYLELLSAVAVYDRVTATYGAGGNVTINESGGGSAITGVISNANSFAAATDKVVEFKPLAAAGRVMTANKGLNLVAASAFTNPGTAAGTISVRIRYRIHASGL